MFPLRFPFCILEFHQVSHDPHKITHIEEESERGVPDSKSPTSYQNLLEPLMALREQPTTLCTQKVNTLFPSLYLLISVVYPSLSLTHLT